MTGAGQFEDRDWELDDHDWSDKAWMSVTDAELFEALIRRKAREGRPLEILEWGSGRSTLYFAGLLADLGTPFRWLSLEYDRGFFDQELRPQLHRLPDPRVVTVDADARGTASAGEHAVGPARRSDQSVDFVVFDKGRLQPQLRAHKEDRRADLDDYVAYPARQGRRYDVVLVDGRKRRRCLIEASGMLKEDGVALLHDAWRPYYHCAFDHFRSERRIGDILWIGGQMGEEELSRLLESLQSATGT